MSPAEIRSLGWGQIDCKDKFEVYPKGAQVKQIATKIADTGCFWIRVDYG